MEEKGRKRGKREKEIDESERKKEMK